MEMTHVSESAGTTKLFVAGVNEMMQRKSVTKRWLSEQSGVSLRAIRQLLNNKSASCTLMTTDAIAEALGTTTFEILRKGKRVSEPV